jgi:hypothetical protein
MNPRKERGIKEKTMNHLLKIMKTAALITVVASCVPAIADRENTAPTGWWWMHNASEADIDAKVAQGFRLFDIEVEQTAPYRFSGVFVKNEGDYAKNWYWKYGYTEAQLEQFMSDHNQRLLDLEVVRVSGQPRLAATMIRNSGDDATAWWYYYDRSFDYIQQKVHDNNGRIIDLDTYVVNGTRYFSAVMVRNTGNQFRNWWWYSNLTWTEVLDKLSLHHARLEDVESRGDGHYAVVMQALNGEYWWYALGRSEQQLIDFYGQRGARVIDLETYTVDGQPRFNAVMLNNSTELETNIGKMFRDNTDGMYGFYLKRVGGGVIANIFDEKPFYPASAIKVLEHVFAIHKVQDGLWIHSPVPLWPNSTSDTHVGDPPPPTGPLDDVLTQMMVPSSNSAANNIQDYFGNANGILGRFAMNLYSWNTIGLSSDMNLRHKMGTGGPDGNDPFNTATLKDFGILYEKVANGALLDEDHRETFYSLMLSRPWGTNASLFNEIDDIVDEECANLGISNQRRDLFKQNMQMAYKGGSLSVSLKYVAHAGWLRLPLRVGVSRAFAYQGFVFGTFVHGYTYYSPPESPLKELLRPVVRGALTSWR